MQRLIEVVLATICAVVPVACNSSHPANPSHRESKAHFDVQELRGDLLGKTRAEVEAKLGPPLTTSSTDHTVMDPRKASAKEMQEWRDAQLRTTYTELEYENIAVSLNARGQVFAVTVKQPPSN